MTLLLPGFRPPSGWCRECRKPIHGSEGQVARHLRDCGQRFYEREHAQLHAMDVLNPSDPEWADFVMHDKRYKPSTKRI